MKPGASDRLHPRGKAPAGSRAPPQPERRWDARIEIVMATVVAKTPIERFLAQPGDAFHDFHELHNGEIVEMPPPTVEHFETQARLVAALDARSGGEYIAAREFYYTLPTEARRADVVMVSKDRLEAQRRKVFFGSPELVVEILSPANSHMDVDHLREACFEHHCVEFWVVNMELQTVTVHAPARGVHVYVPGDRVPLDAFRVSSALSVSDLFPE